jgi:hypothetical protein
MINLPLAGRGTLPWRMHLAVLATAAVLMLLTGPPGLAARRGRFSTTRPEVCP